MLLHTPRFLTCMATVASDVSHKVALQGCCIDSRWVLMHVFNAFTALFLMRKEELPVHINTCCQLPDSLPLMHTGGGCHAFRAATSHLLLSLLLHFFNTTRIRIHISISFSCSL